MREELLFARSSLIASGESAKVESVIRLLEQTYERLRHDTEDEVIETNSVDENYNVVKLMVSLFVVMVRVPKSLIYLDKVPSQQCHKDSKFLAT